MQAVVWIVWRFTWNLQGQRRCLPTIWRSGESRVRWMRKRSAFRVEVRRQIWFSSFVDLRWFLHGGGAWFSGTPSPVRIYPLVWRCPKRRSGESAVKNVSWPPVLGVKACHRCLILPDLSTGVMNSEIGTWWLLYFPAPERVLRLLWW